MTSMLRGTPAAAGLTVVRFKKEVGRMMSATSSVRFFAGSVTLDHHPVRTPMRALAGRLSVARPGRRGAGVAAAIAAAAFRFAIASACGRSGSPGRLHLTWVSWASGGLREDVAPAQRQCR
jgi:hypothetical protein